MVSMRRCSGTGKGLEGWLAKWLRGSFPDVKFMDGGVLFGCIWECVLGVCKGLDAEDLLIVRPDLVLH